MKFSKILLFIMIVMTMSIFAQPSSATDIFSGYSFSLGGDGNDQMRTQWFNYFLFDSLNYSTVKSIHVVIPQGVTTSFPNETTTFTVGSVGGEVCLIFGYFCSTPEITSSDGYGTVSYTTNGTGTYIDWIFVDANLNSDVITLNYASPILTHITSVGCQYNAKSIWAYSSDNTFATGNYPVAFIYQSSNGATWGPGGSSTSYALYGIWSSTGTNLGCSEGPIEYTSVAVGLQNATNLTSTEDVKPPISGDWVDALFDNGFISAILIFSAFAGIGIMIGGAFGAIIGFLFGFIACVYYGILPMWTLFLFFVVCLLAVGGIYMARSKGE